MQDRSQNRVQIRATAFPIWAAISLFWLIAIGGLAASGYMEARFVDAVKLEQQAKDIRAAGLDPATVAWGGPVQVGDFTVAPVQLEAPQFWSQHRGDYARLAVSLPLALLLLIEMTAAAVAQRRKRARKPAAVLAAKSLAIPTRAASFAPCMAVSSAAPPSSR